MEAYRKVQGYKGKKKSPSKKEKEMFYKSLRERDAIAKELQHHDEQRWQLQRHRPPTWGVHSPREATSTLARTVFCRWPHWVAVQLRLEWKIFTTYEIIALNENKTFFCTKLRVFGGLGRPGMGVSCPHLELGIWSWGQKLHVTLMLDRCQSNGNDQLSLLEINVSRYMIKLDLWPWPPSPRLKNGSRAPACIHRLLVVE